MKIDNKYTLGEYVSLPWDSKKYEIYKIGVMQHCIEYLLWDWVDTYPWWFHEWQLKESSWNIWFK